MAKKREIVRRELSIPDAVSEAFGELQSLAQEMTDWADNIEEKFSQTDKYQRIRDAADILEGLSEPSPDDTLNVVKVSFTELPPKRRGYSRADRCGQACYILDECIQVLDELIEEDTKLKDAAESLRDDIDNLKAEAEGVEFPGMYG